MPAPLVWILAVLLCAAFWAGVAYVILRLMGVA